MKNQKLKRKVSRKDINTLANAIAREIVHWCHHRHGNVSECLARHIESTDSYDMYVPKKYEKLYRRVLRSRKKTTVALNRAVLARLMKALTKMKKATRAKKRKAAGAE